MARKMGRLLSIIRIPNGIDDGRVQQGDVVCALC